MPSLPTKDDGGEPIGPSLSSQGGLDDRKMRRELAGIRGSVALSGSDWLSRVVCLLID